MADFHQSGGLTTLHDLGTAGLPEIESRLEEATREAGIGLVLPVTAADLRAEPFARIVESLHEAPYVSRVCVALSRAPDPDDYRTARRLISGLGERAGVLWLDGEGVGGVYRELTEAGLSLDLPGKGRAVWTAFGALLGDRDLSALVVHDCDIVDYDRLLLARLCLPVAHPSLDFEFAKAFYHRASDRLYGRVTRLLVGPLLQALRAITPADPLLQFLAAFRYPLAGEFAISPALARSNRVPGGWGLEIGTLAEVFRNTSIKRVCQVDLGVPYEHKHRDLSLDAPERGLMGMATEIVGTLLRVLASRGVKTTSEGLGTLRAAYLRLAQDAIRQYHADALLNGLRYDRHDEERAIEGFALQICRAGEAFLANPTTEAALPTWARVLATFPDLPARLEALLEEE